MPQSAMPIGVTTPAIEAMLLLTGDGSPSGRKLKANPTGIAMTGAERSTFLTAFPRERADGAFCEGSPS